MKLAILPAVGEVLCLIGFQVLTTVRPSSESIPNDLCLCAYFINMSATLKFAQLISYVVVLDLSVVSVCTGTV